METEPLMEHKSENSIEKPAVLRERRVLGPEQKDESAEQRDALGSSVDSIEVIDVKTQVSEDVFKPSVPSEKTSSYPSQPRGKPQTQCEDEEQSSSQTLDSSSQLAAQKQNIDLEEPNWQEMFMKGIENRENTLLTEYTTTLRNYKEVKRKLLEVEKRNQDGATDDTAMQLMELKSANASKDEEIQALHKKLSLLQRVVAEVKNSKEKIVSSGQSETSETPVIKERDMGSIEMILIDQIPLSSEAEEKLMMDIDQLLEENLDYWLRFSATLHQIQK